MKLLLALLLVHSFYPPHCCNESDCRPIECEQVTREVRLSGHGDSVPIVVYTNAGKRYYAKASIVRASPDGRCHACFWAGTANMRCLWMPQAII